MFAKVLARQSYSDGFRLFHFDRRDQKQSRKLSELYFTSPIRNDGLEILSNKQAGPTQGLKNLWIEY